MGSSNDATIMEILKVWFYVGIEDGADLDMILTGCLSTTLLRSNSATVNVANMFANILSPTTFASFTEQRALLTSGAHVAGTPHEIDLTDNNGNGILVATDRIFVTTGMLNNTVVSASCVKILYRMVNVGITEYVGIVQSQIA